MSVTPRVLVLGGTGRTGSQVLTQLLDRDVPVLAIVRSADRLPAAAVGHAQLTVVEADPLALTVEELARHLDGCDTVISCLGHTISPKGILGPPRDLVERAVRSVHAAASASAPARPVRLILMSSVSVNQPHHADTRRGRGERAYMGLMRAAVPPARDNQRAADFLTLELGSSDRALEWVIVRPDTLRDGAVREYEVTGELVASLFRPESTRMAQVAHFMCELATDDAHWQQWRGRMPVIIDTGGARD
jgi:uncharacterized protein YbjT (DUF2867 family)